MQRLARFSLRFFVLPLFIAAAVAFQAGPAQGAPKTWVGNTDANWNTGANWSPSALASNDTPTFGAAGASGAELTNDTDASTTYNGITFNNGADAFTIGGSNITLAGNISVGTGISTETINFDMTLSANRTITVNSGTLALGGVVSGAGFGLTKAGAGTLVLSGTNTFSGGITVQRDGILRSGADNVLPDAGVTMAAGTLDLNGYSDTIGSGSGNAISFYTTGGAYNLTNIISTGAGTLTLNGNIGVDSDARTVSNIISGKLDLGNATRTVNNGSYRWPGDPDQRAKMTPVHISADISGAAGVGITSYNNGIYAMLRLSGNNSYSGTTTLNGGYLQADSATALGIGGNITFAGGSSTLQYTANSAGSDWSTRFKNSNNAIKLDTGGQTVTLAGVIDNSNTAGLTKLSAGTLILAGADAYGGGTTVNEGTLRSGADEVVPNGSGVTVSGDAAGVTATLDLNGFSDTIAALTFGGATTNSGAVVTTGAGTLILGGNVTYDVANNPLGATLSGNLSLGSATRAFTIGNSTTAENDLTVSAGISSTGGGLTKAGAGTLVLSGTNTYAGATTVNAGGGVLQFNSTNAIAGSGRNVTVSGPSPVGAVALGYVPAATIQDDLLSRITTNSSGAVALTADTAESFDFSGAGNNFTALSLGACGSATYTGTLTPNGATYYLGGGGGTLTMANANAITGAGKSLVINSPGTVILAASDDYTGATTINSGATLQLGAGPIAGASIANAGTLIFNNADNQTYAGVISGAGNLVKNGAGNLALSGANTYTGTTTVNAGTLSFPNGASDLVGNKPITLNGGIFDIGTNSIYVGSLSGTNGTIVGTGSLTVNESSATTFGGSISDAVNFIKSGSQTLTLTNDNPTTGTMTVNGGGLTFTNLGALLSASTVSVNGASLTLKNTGTNLAARINNAAPIMLDSGTIIYNGANSTNSTETLGAVTVNAGVSIISATPGTGAASAVLALSSLTRGTGAGLNLNPGNASNLGTTNNPYGNIKVTTFPGSNLTAVNGVISGAFSCLQDAWYLVGYDATKGFGILGTAGYPANYTGTFAAALPTSNLNGVSGAVANNFTVNSLNQGTVTFPNGTATGGPDLLTIASGMTIAGVETFGTPTQRGRITSGTQELFILHRDGNATPNPIFNSVIVDNGNPVSLVVYSKHGDRGPYLVLSAPNQYSGGTFVTGGTAQGGILLYATSSGTVVIPAGGLTINNQGVVDMATFEGQIDPSNVVTINGGGVLNLMGTNTLAGIVFNSNGGATTPSVVPYNTITGSLGNPWSAYGAKTGTLIITGNISSTPANVAVTPLIDSGYLDLNNSTAHDITITPQLAGNYYNGVGPLNGLTISSMIQNGGFTVKGGGVLNLTGASTFAGQLTVEEGVLNVASVNNISAAGVLGQSASSVILGKAGGTGTLEVTATTTGSKPFTMAGGGAGVFQIDTGTTTLSGVIDGGGGLTKTGAGTLVLSGASAYKGNTTVIAGTLDIRSPCLSDFASVYLSSGGTMALNFNGTDTIRALFLNGVPQDRGTYGGTNSAAGHKLPAFFSGSGMLWVGSPNGATLIIR